MAEESVSLFSYGTLQLPSVQKATFGRLLDGRSDALRGYVLAPLEIKDDYVIATSGLAVHQMALESNDPAARITGVVFSITPGELAAADSYEVSEMKRVEVELESGTRAFVYVGISG